ncbi:MAG TPA: imidazole glycerol phosphate synthase subunit HisF [Marinilabiliales bacterium]|nr:MAG: imidazole glycerol phosphate synthase subunit HisF [Bacteroidetes bacterium GWD2_40_43]OFX95613.1 MAG: imidazole glycerol phosphate synthase subunit HisF [Bacteroidetes bacterium GWE2_40_63]OFY22229.1 MAG: imidazole glycerol phosphate synthase subunit HisF [Bacteroidetes bacterium GWF2_40_13]OFZ24868.1 MAG: imidazole glycerol phosphate synthase subunit HisF [Bacteroidetes bacterium RIFOXYC2_FULL_40_12]HAM98301.1 imidazole glycerol phosphate synthase subunit HisF [Marinilabiliales bacter
MLAKRIIPCLDVKDGRTVKGVNFLELRDAGDPVELGAFYAQNGADELCFLDISATLEQRKTFASLVKEIAQHVNIPFTVGGGINGIEQVGVLLESGADKITVNSASVKNPQLVNDLARQFGSQCVVVAIDTKWVNNQWHVFIHGGTQPTPLLTTDWAKQVQELGAGEILLTSMNHDGTKNGFALEITRQISLSVSIPVIASGGAGTMVHFKDVFTQGMADAALAASIFHFKEIEINDLKNYLRQNKIPMR